MDDINNLAKAQIELYVDLVAFHQEAGDADLHEFFQAQVEELASKMDEAELMTLTYHRHLSESFGVVFELEHNDPELIFGGV